MIECPIKAHNLHFPRYSAETNFGKCNTFLLTLAFSKFMKVHNHSGIFLLKFFPYFFASTSKKQSSGCVQEHNCVGVSFLINMQA